MFYFRSTFVLIIVLSIYDSTVIFKGKSSRYITNYDSTDCNTFSLLVNKEITLYTICIEETFNGCCLELYKYFSE